MKAISQSIEPISESMFITGNYDLLICDGYYGPNDHDSVKSYNPV